MTDRVGQQIGQYRLVQLLGRGGFAEVYLGKHVLLDTFAAVKILLTQLSGNDVQQFLKEARYLAQLNHPNIIHVLDSNVYGDTPILIMGYAPNGTLRQRYKPGVPVPMISMMPHIQQIASALDYAHSQNIIHRDVKPENMLLGSQNEVLLSDFVIAKNLQSSRSIPSQGVAGTVSYMAPEQINSNPCPASDQYALGIIVYEWLCGHRPFSGTFTEIIAKQIHAVPPPLGQILPGFPPSIERVVMRALDKNPQSRFSSTKDFANALEQAWRNPSNSLVLPPQQWRQSVEIPQPQQQSVVQPYLVPPPQKPIRSTEPQQQPGVLQHPAQPLVAPEQLRFTAFHPKEIAVESWNTLLVYAHIEPVVEAVYMDAQRFKAELGDAPRKTSAPAIQLLLRETNITVVPECKGVVFNPKRFTFKWLEDWHRASFRFSAKPELAGSAGNGRINVFAGPLLVGTLKLALLFEEQNTLLPAKENTTQETANLYKQIFASYSHDDSLIVLTCRDVFKTLGFNTLIDIDTLRSGQKFSDALKRMIDAADIFQLFWSERSAKSTYVTEEWEYALRLNRGEGFVRPVYWEVPMTKPPEKLAPLHFAYLPVYTFTRPQSIPT